MSTNVRVYIISMDYVLFVFCLFVKTYCDLYGGSFIYERIEMLRIYKRNTSLSYQTIIFYVRFEIIFFFSLS